MSCENCAVAKKNPAWRMFNPACLYCGARLIQVLGMLAITRTDCRDRRRAVLADWGAQGHAEADLRRLAGGPVALPPVLGVEAVVPQKSTRLKK